ncbi:MAG TPA: acyl-CoA dehydrogenase family protein [Ktedonobacteraceae bacterium]|nr:acyl-CoA dehydrogenase family protein [Ktedonobacteraceae bacterium]
MLEQISLSGQDILLGEKRVALRNRMRAFATTEVAPHAARIDQEAQFPHSVYRRAASEGLVGFTRPLGAGRDTLDWALMMEEVGAASAAVADILLLSEMVALILDEAGSERQRTLLPPLLAGETLGAFALTEPNAGSDAAAIETLAVPDGDDFILNGTKAYINNASIADWAIVQAKTSTEAGTRGITAFLIHNDQFTSGPPYDLMGQRGIAVGELYLKDSRLHRSAIVGKMGEGFKLAMRALDVGRIGVGAMAVGIARAAYDAAVAYAGQRRQFGRQISSFQGIRWMLADMDTDIAAARLLVHQAARLRDAGTAFTREAAMAKLRASDVAMSVTLNALQIHGGAGYRKDLPLERYVRDAKLTQIYEGTNQILRQVIARGI